MGGNDECGAGGLSEGSEQIGTHTSDISDVITDVVSDGSWVRWVVFLEILEGLSDKISTDISGLGVDTTSDSSEESDGGTSETVSGDELEEAFGELLCLVVLSGLIKVAVINALDGAVVVAESENPDEHLENQEGESDQAETEDLSASEGSEETGVDVVAALEGGSSVGVDCNSHANVACQDGSGRTNQVCSGSVWEVSGKNSVSLAHFLPVDGQAEDDGNSGRVDSEVKIFF